MKLQFWASASKWLLAKLIAMNTIQLLITFQAKPEAAADFAAMLAEVKKTLPSVHGCRSVRLFAGHQDACLFSLLEEWESVALHQTHIERVVSSGEWARIRAQLAADPVSHYVTEC